MAYKQAIPAPNSRQVIQKSEPTVAAESRKQVADASQAVSHPKVDYATDLFNMLSMDGPNENGSGATSADDNAWAGFQCMSKFPSFLKQRGHRHHLLLFRVGWGVWRGRVQKFGNCDG